MSGTYYSLSGSVLIVNKNFLGKSNTAGFDCDEAFFDAVTLCLFFCLGLHYTWPAKYQASTWSLDGISYISTKQAPKIKSNGTACRLSTIFVWVASTTCVQTHMVELRECPAQPSQYKIQVQWQKWKKHACTPSFRRRFGERVSYLEAPALKYISLPALWGSLNLLQTPKNFHIHNIKLQYSELPFIMR